jgi:hypothetical protein
LQRNPWQRLARQVCDKQNDGGVKNRPLKFAFRLIRLVYFGQSRWSRNISLGIDASKLKLIAEDLAKQYQYLNDKSEQ